jgi:hypothetical protein
MNSRTFEKGLNDFVYLLYTNGNEYRTKIYP